MLLMPPMMTSQAARAMAAPENHLGMWNTVFSTSAMELV